MATTTLSDSRIRLRKMLMLDNVADVDDNGLTAADATRYINEEMQAWWLETANSFPDIAVTEVAMTYTANASSVAIPAGATYRRIRAVFWLPTGGVAPTDRVKLRSGQREDIEAAWNCPWTWSQFWRDGTLGIRPVPTEALTLTLITDTAMTELSVGSDTAAWVPQELWIGIIRGAASRYFDERMDQVAAEMWRKRADSDKEKFAEFVQQINPPVGYKRRATSYGEY